MSDDNQSAPESSSRRHRRRISADEKMLLDRIKARENEVAREQAEPKGFVPKQVRTDAEDWDEPRVAPPPGDFGQGKSASDTRGALSVFFNHPLVRGALRLLKLLVRFSCLFYGLGLALVAWAIHQYGQSNVTTATLMYLPPLLWLAPCFFLAPAALLFDWKSLVLILVTTFAYLNGHLDFQWRAEADLPAPEPFVQLRLLTWNRGQSGSTSLGPIKDAVKPDFILLQDAAGRGSRYRSVPEYGEFTDFVDAGEFVLMSRWPVLSSQSLTMPTENGSMVPIGAARFVVMHAGRRVALYNVHLPSPRDALEATGRGAFLLGVLGLPGTPWESKKLHYQTFWDLQMRKAAEIARRIRTDTLPVIVAGDFNTPAFGPIYRLYAEMMQDAHVLAGSGLGQTFPGDTRNPLAFFHPWLRLDQVFASSEWEVLHSQPQRVRSQHLPVFTVLKHKEAMVRPSSFFPEGMNAAPAHPPTPSPP